MSIISVDATRTGTGAGGTSITITSQVAPSGNNAALLVIWQGRQSSARQVTGISWGDSPGLTLIYRATWGNDMGIEFWGILEKDFSSYTANLVASVDGITTEMALTTLSVSNMHQTLTPNESDSFTGALATQTDYIDFSSVPNAGFLNLVAGVSKESAYEIQVDVAQNGQTSVLTNVWTAAYFRASAGYEVMAGGAETTRIRFYNVFRVSGSMQGAYVSMRSLAANQPRWFS